MKTKKCTKAVCSPRCQNGGLCKKPQVCFCKPGFEGPRCEQVTPTQLPTLLPSSDPVREALPPPGLVSASLPPFTAAAFSRNVSPVTASPALAAAFTETASNGSGSVPKSPVKISVPPFSSRNLTAVPASNSTLVLASQTSKGAKESPRITKTASSIAKKQVTVLWQPLTLQEVQSVLQKKSLGSSQPKGKLAAVLMKHMESEQSKLATRAALKVKKRNVKTIRIPRGEYTIEKTSIKAACRQGQ
nr:PREDICTED: latent-transforming growth factor beta-binding protein 2-like [Latimeria chalumnae]|eukprot:XP_014341365.1 PREDICTED: latent-transforming growth factor beta-binding protein 2-like [Latimeria chalumnae]